MTPPKEGAFEQSVQNDDLKILEREVRMIENAYRSKRQEEREQYYYPYFK